MRPNLLELRLEREKIKNWSEFPFSVSVIRNLNKINFQSQVTFLVGENGSGKSTILEAIANVYGFGKEGGSKNISFETSEKASVLKLSEVVKLSWREKILGGYFFRAESFFNLASYLDNLEDKSVFLSYGGESLHEQSHGESFLALFQNRFSKGGFFLLDEPEAALSPQRQLSFLVILNEILKNKDTQFIIATHSPILLAYPGAQILSFDGGKIKEIKYKETEPYKITKGFLENTENYLEKLLEKTEE